MHTNPRQIAKLLRDENTFGSVLLLLSVAKIHPKAATWDPEALSLELAETFQVTPNPTVLNKLFAAQAAVASDAFYTSLPDFVSICNGLTDGVPPSDFDPAEIDEIAWGITEATFLWPPPRDNQNPFAAEIVQYVGQMLAREGMLKPPLALAVGLKDDDPWGQIHSEFSEDPVMFAAISQMQKERTDEIDNWVENQTRLFFEQLFSLNLENLRTPEDIQRLL